MRWPEPGMQPAHDCLYSHGLVTLSRTWHECVWGAKGGGEALNCAVWLAHPRSAAAACCCRTSADLAEGLPCPGADAQCAAFSKHAAARGGISCVAMAMAHTPTPMFADSRCCGCACRARMAGLQALPGVCWLLPRQHPWICNVGWAPCAAGCRHGDLYGATLDQISTSSAAHLLQSLQ